MDIQEFGERIVTNLLILIMVGLLVIHLFPPPYSYMLLVLAVIGSIPYTALEELLHYEDR